LYSLLLGNTAMSGMGAIDPQVFAQHGDAKLRVWFSDGVNGFQQLSPDRPFASVPYAMSAGSASLGDGSVSTAKMDPNLVRYFIPEISSNPASVSILQGTGTTLSIQANGKFLTYQWQRNGVNLAGETNASLVLSDANASVDDANYSVVISNDWGKVTSQLVSISVATASPTITLNGLASLTHEATTAYTDAGASALDALGNDLNSSIRVTGADLNVTSVGPHLITYSVTDAGGNSNTVVRQVRVEDSTAPDLFLRGDSNYTHWQNSIWIDPGYEANDKLDGNLTANVSITGTYDVNTTGTYILTYTVSDRAGNKVDVNRTLNVQSEGPWTFTNAGATGRVGPSENQINSSYNGSNLDGFVDEGWKSGFQQWTVPFHGTYRIEAYGAQGGNQPNRTGGKGSIMRGSFILNQGSFLNIVVGQMGESNSQSGGAAGGGGSFVVSDNNNTPLIIAGGGGGAGSNANGYNAKITTQGGTGYRDESGGGSGLGGDGGSGSGGGGFLSNGNGYSLQGGRSYQNGALGGLTSVSGLNGGFGGGGATKQKNWGDGGGGGGYSGGAGSWWGYMGAGGGSYNSGTAQNNEAGVQIGHGKVIIIFLGN